MLKPFVCPTHQPDQDRTKPIFRLTRIFEATAHLDKNHDIIHRTMAEGGFDIDELMLNIQAVETLQTLLKAEIGDGVCLYSGGLMLCHM
jgi:hypothetical protein